MPKLEDGDRRLTESVTIPRDFAEEYGLPQNPKNFRQRANRKILFQVSHLTLPSIAAKGSHGHIVGADRRRARDQLTVRRRCRTALAETALLTRCGCSRPVAAPVRGHRERVRAGSRTYSDREQT